MMLLQIAIHVRYGGSSLELYKYSMLQLLFVMRIFVEPPQSMSIILQEGS